MPVAANSATNADAGGDPATDPADELVGTVLAGHYRIEAKLGEGGMGAVYRATHVLMRKTVALKVLHAEMASIPEALARFEREAVAAGRIEHPNIASALDFGRLPDGSFYLVMEYVPGEVLRNVLGEGRLPLERVVRIGVQIASALDAAHAAGIVHRDLKPENVIVNSRHGADQIKLLDLGIAKVSIEHTNGGTALTRAGMVLGTPQYMAPEQGMGGTVDHRSDLYAFGVLLYEMAAGKPPFSDDDGAIATIARHLTESPPPLPAAIPDELAALILQLLEKRAQNRPQSAAEVVQRLQALASRSEAAPLLVEAEALAAAPVVDEAPLLVRRERWWSKKRFALLGAAAVVVALVTLGSARPNETSAKPTAPTASAVITASTAPDTGTTVPRARTEPTAAPAPPPPTPSTATAPTTERKTSEGAPAPKGKPKRVKKQRREERRTGPGGIYIPPPEDWF